MASTAGFKVGDRVEATYPGKLGTMTGVLEEGELFYNEEPLMFIPDEKFEPRLDATGYDPDNGLYPSAALSLKLV